MKQRVGIVSIVLLVGAIVAASNGAHGVEAACLFALAAAGVAYLVLRVREHRREVVLYRPPQPPAKS